MNLVAGLVAGLLLSLAGNVAAVYMLGEASAEKSAAAALAEAKGRADALSGHLSSVSLVATMAQADFSALVGDLRDVADRSRQRITIYRDRQVPVAGCSPGASRVDAVNAVLGVDGAR